MVTPSRFVNRDVFARFAGIGIGCQRLQASQVLNIQIGKDHTEPQPDGTGLHTGGSDDGALERDVDDDLGSESDGSGDDDLGLEPE